MMEHVKHKRICSFLGGLLAVAVMASLALAGPPASYTQEHTITIDATTINLLSVEVNAVLCERVIWTNCLSVFFWGIS